MGRRQALWHSAGMHRLQRLSPLSRWSVLAAMSLLTAGVLQLLHFPAALLLGCMLCGIAFSTHDIELQVAPRPFLLAQALIGGLMAQSLRPQALERVAHDWPLFIGFNALVMLASAWLGWQLVRRHLLPGTTAVWGLAPGAASAMVLLADSYGADARLVAFMQYLRVVIVTALASLVARIWLGAAPDDQASFTVANWFAVHSAFNVSATLAVLAAGYLISQLLGWVTGALMLPLLMCMGLQAGGWLQVELPPILLGLSYALIGWSIGLRFSRDILQHAWRALPTVLMAIATLIALGLVLAVALAWLGGMDPLSAYLATSPGGADSVAIIAAHAASVDAGFVMAMQLARFFLVFALGPTVSRWVAEHAGAEFIQRD